MENIQNNLAKIRAAIVAAEKKYQRTSGSVALVAVAKSQPVEKIKVLSSLGQSHIAESYLQEALPKIQALSTENILWHYIGRIQSKKTKLIALNFSWVETVASYEIAELLSNHRPINMQPLNICIQVNISKDPNKAGVSSDEILPLAKKILLLPRLKLCGLMTIPAYQENFAQQFKIFNDLSLELKKLQQQGMIIDTLSMGMSGDFEAAIASGATMIRIGTAIFGKRGG